MVDITNVQIRFAIKAARQAALLVKDIQEEMVTGALEKGDKSPVTVADFAAQAIVSQLLQTTFPDSLLVGEEDAETLSKDQAVLDKVAEFVRTRIQKTTRRKVLELIDFGSSEPGESWWTLDPIDGTKGFLRGEQYAVALAFVEKGQVQIGVLACPNLTDGYQQEVGGPGSLIVAQQGEGTWTTNLSGGLDFTKLSVSDISENNQARFLRSFEAGHTNVSQLDLIAQEMGVSADPVRLDSQAKYSILAAGAGDALFRLISEKMPDYKEKVWDQAAGSIVCEEAGGKITDLDGKPLDFTQGRTLANNRGILATNGKLHEAALSAIKAVGA